MAAKLARTPTQASTFRNLLVLVSLGCVVSDDGSARQRRLLLSGCKWGHCLTTTPSPVLPKDNIDEGAIVAGVAGATVIAGSIGAGIAAVALQKRKVAHKNVNATGLNFAQHHPGDVLPPPSPMPTVSIAPSFERHPPLTTTTVGAYVANVERQVAMTAQASTSPQLSMGYEMPVVTTALPLAASTSMLQQGAAQSSGSFVTSIVWLFLIASMVSAALYCLCFAMRRRVKRTEKRGEVPEARAVSHAREDDTHPMQESVSSNGSDFPILPNVLLPMTPSVVNGPNIVNQPTSVYPIPYTYESAANVLAKYAPKQAVAPKPVSQLTPAPSVAPTSASARWIQSSPARNQQPPLTGSRQPSPARNQQSALTGSRQPPNQPPAPPSKQAPQAPVPQQSLPTRAPPSLVPQQSPPKQAPPAPVPQQSLPTRAPNSWVPQQQQPPPKQAPPAPINQQALPTLAPPIAYVQRTSQPTVPESFQREVPVVMETGVVRELIATSPTEALAGLTQQRASANIHDLPVVVEAGVNLGVAGAALGFGQPQMPTPYSRPMQQTNTGLLPLVVEAGLNPNTASLQQIPSAAIANHARQNMFG